MSTSNIAMQAPTNLSGQIICNAPTQSGISYNLSEPGGALLVEQPDVAEFETLGATPVPSVQPTINLRAGLVFWDEAANEYLRFNGTNWAPITLQ
jgi:hypothetical protein